MSEPSGQPAPAGGFDRAFRGTVGREATAFGFSIVISGTFAMIQYDHGSPSRWQILLFALGAGASFLWMTAAASRGFRQPLPQHRTGVLAIAAGLNLISIMAGIGTAMAGAAVLPGNLAWPLCPLASASVYLLVESLEEWLAERVAKTRGEDTAESVDE